MDGVSYALSGVEHVDVQTVDDEWRKKCPEISPVGSQQSRKQIRSVL